jgi:hypothetical protein
MQAVKDIGNDNPKLAEKFPQLKDYLENAKQVVDQPLDGVTTNIFGVLDLYSLHHSSFPWDTLVVFLLKLQDNLKPCNQPCVRYDDRFVYYGQVNPDDGKPFECGFYRKQTKFDIYLYFYVDQNNQVEIQYSYDGIYSVSEKIDGTTTYEKKI